MHHSVELFIVTLFASVLLVGAAMRGIARIAAVPFTILMLIFGFLAGFYIRYYTAADGFFSYLHHGGGHSVVSPELILFIFLPMLIFESAFSLDAHVFRKLLVSISALAGPALVLTTCMTAYLMLTITHDSWKWTLNNALLFGALINATDPVAVVALLREFGLSKRLVTLIEGESLLNDGTAIVLFTVFFGMSLGGSDHFDIMYIFVQFAKVVIGGLIIGYILAQFISRWIGKVFNDPLVEITLMMALAYLCMVIAEGVFHVSGVMALVVAGLYMSSIGRTRISPEVKEFLDEFWEAMSYIANTLIFFLVGLVIAIQVEHFEIRELWVALVVYIGIMVIRTVVIFLFRPLFRLIKTPLQFDHAVIASWGGLRGAVSLALALVLSQSTGLDESFRQQALLLTVVTVLITVIFNGGTMKYVLKILKLDKPSLAVQISANLAKLSVLNDVKKMVMELSNSDNFRNVFWSDIREGVESSCKETKQACDSLQDRVEKSSGLDQEVEFWLRILNVERAAYWELFAEGILTAKALSTMTHEIDLQVDNLKEKRVTPPQQRTPKTGKFYVIFKRILHGNALLQKLFGFIIFDHIMLRFQCFHAERFAAKKVLDSIHALAGMKKSVEQKIQETYRLYLNNAKERLEEMRVNLPELSQALETHFAKRITLNHERDGINMLVEHGILDAGSAKDSIQSVETRIHQLRSLPKYMILPSTKELLKEVKLFELCSDEERQELANAFVEQVVLKGDYVFNEGDKSNSMFIVARGALEIVKEIEGKHTVLAVLGGGEIVGEMALLTGQPRMASALAATTVTLLEINAKDFNQITSKYPSLRQHTWLAYGRHLLYNMLKTTELFKNKSQEEIARIISISTFSALDANATTTPEANCDAVFIISGEGKVDDEIICGPAIISIQAGQTISAKEKLNLLWLYTEDK